MYYPNSGLSFTDQLTGYTWQQSMKASYVVPAGYQGLPGSKGDIQFPRIHNPSRFGIPTHPLVQYYPQLEVLHYAMVIDFDRMAEQVGDKRGIAFWLSNNGSDPCVSVTSEFGRSNVAPIGWEYGMGEDRNPIAKPYWEWRTTIQDGLPWTWTNARMHGWSGWNGEHLGKDWIDGVPESVVNMYDPRVAKTRQTIVTPKFLGLGTAQQTLPPDALVNTYSIMLYYPRPDKKAVWEKMRNFQSLMTYDAAVAKYRASVQSSGMSRSVSRGGALESFGAKGVATRGVHEESALESAVEITHGNELSQHIVQPINDSTLWRQEPSAVIVCWPLTPTQVQAMDLNRPAEVGEARKGMW